MADTVKIAIGETFEPVRVRLISRSTGKPIANMTGTTAVFTLWDPDGETKLLEDLPATVEFEVLPEDPTAIKEFRFFFSAGDWTTLAAARADDLAARGYTAQFTATTTGGKVFYAPNSECVARVEIEIRST